MARLLRILLALLLSMTFPALHHVATATATAGPSTLNITAITAANGESAVECWQLGPFVTATEPGISGASTLALGQLANATYTVIPARSDGGWHNAPVPQ